MLGTMSFESYLLLLLNRHFWDIPCEMNKVIFWFNKKKLLRHASGTGFATFTYLQCTTNFEARKTT